MKNSLYGKTAASVFKHNKFFVLSKCLLRSCVLLFYVVLCVGFCTGHFVTVTFSLTYLHCLQHSFFEHLFSVYY